jgi:hypothetical protein
VQTVLSSGFGLTMNGKALAGKIIGTDRPNIGRPTYHWIVRPPGKSLLPGEWISLGYAVTVRSKGQLNRHTIPFSCLHRNGCDAQ